MLKKFTITLAVLVSLHASPTLVRAGEMAPNCYEDIGCSATEQFSDGGLAKLSCQALWEVRNRIFKEHRYCFKTALAIEAFGNDGCRHDDEAAVPLNDYERYNIKAVRYAETRKGC